MEAYDLSDLSEDDKALLEAGEVALADYAVEKCGRVLMVCHYENIAIAYAACIRGTVIRYNRKMFAWTAIS